MNCSLLFVFVAVLCTGATTAYPFESNQVMSQDQLEDAIIQWQGMKVLFAYYGLSCAKGVIKSNNQYRSTMWAAKLCDGKNYCQGKVHNSVLTDPYVGCPKDFIIVAECPNGKIIANAVPPVPGEGQLISLSCY